MATSSTLSVVSTEEAQKRIREDADFVHLRRYDYSMKRVTERFPDGVPDRLIATALMITIDDVDRIYADIVSRLREQIADPKI